MKLKATDVFEGKALGAAKAVEKGSADLLENRLLEGVSPNSTGQEGISLLLFSLLADSVPCFTVLLQKGADPNLLASRHDPVIQVAAGARNGAFLPLLLRGKANVDLKGERGTTALIQAVVNLKEDRVGTLLEAGANPDLSDREGLTPLAWAVSFAQAGIAERLLKGGADPRKAGEKGPSAWDLSRSLKRTKMQQLFEEWSRVTGKPLGP